MLRSTRGWPCTTFDTTVRSDDGSLSITAASATARVGSTAACIGGAGSARSRRTAYQTAPASAAIAIGVVGKLGAMSHSDCTRFGPIAAAAPSSTSAGRIQRRSAYITTSAATTAVTTSQGTAVPKRWVWPMPIVAFSSSTGPGAATSTSTPDMTADG